MAIVMLGSKGTQGIRKMWHHDVVPCVQFPVWGWFLHVHRFSWRVKFNVTMLWHIVGWQFCMVKWLKEITISFVVMLYWSRRRFRITFLLDRHSLDGYAVNYCEAMVVKYWYKMVLLPLWGGLRDFKVNSCEVVGQSSWPLLLLCRMNNNSLF